MFAIRQKSTGLFLPRGPGRYGKGFTHVEPSANDVRFFAKKQHAACALRWWLNGKTTTTWTETDNPISGPDVSEEWTTKVVPERDARDMEIVPVKVVVQGEE